MDSPRPTPVDSFPTPTSLSQAETESVLSKHRPRPSDPPPELQRNLHLQFLIRNLVQGFPERYISQDASQPWLLFWTLQSFSALQVGLDPGNKQRAIDTILQWQHPDGGFGGGPGQEPHLLPSYAAVCTLAIVGRPGKGGGWDDIDRKGMYNFFMRLKQHDGSFLVSESAEVDVRGIYCLLITASLLDIITPELVSGTPEFIASCQTYEGGFASASHPSYQFKRGSEEKDDELMPFPRPPLGEAHGGYTFCALASWVLLLPFMNSSTVAEASSTPSLRISSLLRFLVHLQGSQSCLGGFQGRTNKLVDGCYAWWCGGSFALLEALGVGGLENVLGEPAEKDDNTESEVAEEKMEEIMGDEWVDVDESLYDYRALQEYILYAGQHPAGGLRDKPPKNADAYHTLYCLSGLSSAQHHVFPSAARKAAIERAWVSALESPIKGTEDIRAKQTEDLRKAVFSSILSWSEEEATSRIVGGKANRLNATHPLTNLTITHTEGLMEYFYGQKLPPRRERKPASSKSSA